MTIRVRLALAYAATLALSLFLVGAVVWWQQTATARAALDERLVSELTDLADVVATSGPTAIAEAGDEPDIVFVAVFDRAGQRLGAVPGTPPDLGLPLPEGVTERQLGGTPFVLHVRQLTDEWTGVAGASAGPLLEAQASLAGTILTAGVVAAIVSLLAGWWLAGRALAPVGELTAEAAAIGASDLTRRLPTGTHDDELSRLATTLNEMLDRIEGGVRRQRAFLAAASHDLRTPLAALQTELELADRPEADAAELRDAVAAARGDVVRLGELTNGLLELVSAGPDGRALALSAVSLGDVVVSAVDHVRPLATDRYVELRVDVQSATIPVDRVRLEQALRNVVANAITYSPDGGVVEIRGRVEPGSSEPGGPERLLAVDVLDRGAGIPAAESELVFEPFQRGSTALGPGSGLGLSAARAAVTAHGGSLAASPRAGGGTCISIRIPVGDLDVDGSGPGSGGRRSRTTARDAQRASMLSVPGVEPGAR